MKPGSLARDLLLPARSQLREIIEQAKVAAEGAVNHATLIAERKSGPFGPRVEYLRMFAKVAQVQFQALLDAFNEHVSRLSGVPRNRRGSQVRLCIERLRAVAQPWPIQCSSEPTPFRASRSIRPDFNHFPSLINSPVGNGSLQLNKIAEASERLNGNQYVIDERPSPELFDRYEKFVSQRHQQ
jgi:hypothetical protein